MFVNPDYDDFSLQAGSPCIGSGRNGDDRGAIPYQATSIDTSPVKPLAFELAGNYPNPFNGSTTIRYSLNRSDFVVIEIYDPLGRKVESFDIGSRNAGEYSFTWQAGDASSGLYFYRLTTGNLTQTKQMLLLK